jgi:hypothetical protein
VAHWKPQDEATSNEQQQQRHAHAIHECKHVANACARLAALRAARRWIARDHDARVIPSDATAPKPSRRRCEEAVADRAISGPVQAASTWRAASVHESIDLSVRVRDARQHRFVHRPAVR